MNCVFCKIINGSIPAVIVWQDAKHLAILDANPIVEGQTLVITREHADSYVFNLPEQQMTDLYLASREVARKLDQGLGSFRTVQVMEGLGVAHAHIKLYPLMPGHGEGGIVHIGEPATNEELEKVANKLNKERGEDK